MKAYCPIEGQDTSAQEICRISFGQIVQCQPSGLVRFYPPRSPQELAAVHATPAYFNHPYFEARRNLKREALLEKHRATLLRLAAGEQLHGKQLLDVGCDTGSLLCVARDEWGMEVTGVEVSPQAAEVARREYQLNVLVGQVAELDLPPASFDVITLIDVIEHVSDPRHLLGVLHRLLAPGGKLYIVTADHHALINAIGLSLYALLGQKVNLILEKLYIPYHEYYFTQATLAALLQRTHFQVQRQQALEFPLDEFGHGWFFKAALIPIFALQRLLHRQTLQEIIAIKDS